MVLFSTIQGQSFWTQTLVCWTHQRCGPLSAHFQYRGTAAWPLYPHPVTPRPPDAGTLLIPALPSHPPGMLVSGSNWRWEMTHKTCKGIFFIHLMGCDSLQKVNGSFTFAGVVHRVSGCCYRFWTVVWCTLWDELWTHCGPFVGPAVLASEPEENKQNQTAKINMQYNII